MKYRALSLKFPDKKLEAEYNLFIWNENKTIIRLLLSGGLFVNAAYVLTTLLITKTQQVLLSFIFQGVFLFPVTIALFILCLDHPLRNITTQTIWYILLSLNSIMISMASVTKTLSCYYHREPFTSCETGARPTLSSLFLYAILGPFLMLLICKNSPIFQALILLPFLVAFIWNVSVLNNNLSGWVSLIFLFGSYVMIFLIYYQQEKASRANFMYAIKTEENRKKLEHAIEETNLARQAEQESEQKRKNFTNYIFHEIRVPLNTIVLSTNYLEEDQAFNSSITKDQLDVFSRIMQGLSSIGMILNDTLDFGKMTEGRFQISMKPFNFHNMVNNLVWSMQESWKVKNQTLSINYSQEMNDVPFQLISDENRVRQIIANYISNAVKFTPEGGKIELSVKRKETSDDGTILVYIEVKDNGIGISKENQAKLFQPFVQIMSAKGASKGSGLGLAICAGLVDQFHGKYGVSSKVDNGSTFWFEIPLEISNLPLVENEVETSQPIPSTINRNLKVLVTDDEPNTRLIMGKTISRLGYYVDTAFDGLNCLEKMELIKYDVLFIDNMMPRLTGFETIKRIRETNSTIKIISLSASVQLEIQQNLKNIGADKVIIKPCTKAVIDAILTEYSNQEKKIT